MLQMQFLSWHCCSDLMHGTMSEEENLSFCVNRFVGDQEAWHELSELYINEHE